MAHPVYCQNTLWNLLHGAVLFKGEHKIILVWIDAQFLGNDVTELTLYISGNEIGFKRNLDH